MNKIILTQMASLVSLCIICIVTCITYTQLNQQALLMQQMSIYIKHNSTSKDVSKYYNYNSEWQFKQMIESTFLNAQNVSLVLQDQQKEWIEDEELEEFIYELSVKGDLITVRNCISKLLNDQQFIHIHQISMDTVKQITTIKLSLYNKR